MDGGGGADGKLGDGGAAWWAEDAPDSGTVSLTWNNGYGVSDDWKGYAYTALIGSATSTMSPECNAAATAPCFQTAGTQVCASGTVGADPSLVSAAVIGWYINQEDGPPNSPGLGATPGAGLAVDVTVTSGTELRVQLQAADDANSRWCRLIPYRASGSRLIPWSSFNTKCWDNSGTNFVAGTPIREIDIVLPSNETALRYFDFCINNLAPY